MEAGSARIVDEGTTFNVRRYTDRVVVVSVAEGAVTVIGGNAARVLLGRAGIKVDTDQQRYRREQRGSKLQTPGNFSSSLISRSSEGTY